MRKYGKCSVFPAIIIVLVILFIAGCRIGDLPYVEIKTIDSEDIQEAQAVKESGFDVAEGIRGFIADVMSSLNPGGFDHNFESTSLSMPDDPFRDLNQMDTMNNDMMLNQMMNDTHNQMVNDMQLQQMSYDPFWDMNQLDMMNMDMMNNQMMNDMQLQHMAIDPFFGY